MKFRAILFYGLLSLVLLFTQIGVAFLHDDHNSHRAVAKHLLNDEVLLPHGEHCKICSLEILFQLDIPSTTILSCDPIYLTFDDSYKCQDLRRFIHQSSDRGPPAV